MFWVLGIKESADAPPPLIKWTIVATFLVISIALAIWSFLIGRSWVKLSGYQLSGKIGLSKKEILLSQIQKIIFYPHVNFTGTDLLSLVITMIAEESSPEGKVEIITDEGKWKLFRISSKKFLEFMDELENSIGKPIKIEKT